MENTQVHALIYQMQDSSCPETIRINAFESLLEEFKFLLYAVTNYFYCSKKNRGFDFQDVLNDAKSVFYERILKWDPKKKACFRYYISFAIFQYLDNLYTGFFPRDKRSRTVHLDEKLGPFAQMYIIQGSFSEIYKYLVKRYSELHAFIFVKYYDEGYTQEDIATMTGKSQFWVCTSLKKMIKELKNTFTEEAFINKFFV